jgi:hypothetical protein
MKTANIRVVLAVSRGQKQRYLRIARASQNTLRRMIKVVLDGYSEEMKDERLDPRDCQSMLSGYCSKRMLTKTSDIGHGPFSGSPRKDKMNEIRLICLIILT